MKYYFSFLICT